MLEEEYLMFISRYSHMAIILLLSKEEKKQKFLNIATWFILQGKLELKDFNIKKEASGVDKELIKEFKASITNRTLEIRFQWAGKGTTNAPKRGIYGALISAISVESGK